MNEALFLFLLLSISNGRNTNRYLQDELLPKNDTIPYEVVYQPELTIEIGTDATNCEEKTCIMKCCEIGFLFTIHDRKRSECVPVIKYNTTSWEPDLEDVENLVYIIGFPLLDTTLKRPKNITCDFYPEDEIVIGNDGTLYHKFMRERYPREATCMDKAIKNGTIGVYSRICHEHLETQLYHNQNISKILVWIPITFSFIFLILIFVLHFISRNTPDLQKKCTLSACVSLFFGFQNLLLSRVVSFLNEAGCTSVAIMGMFFFMSFYFWFSVMCFEISRIIRGTFKLKPISNMKEQSLRRYLCYCAFAWGFPFLFCCFTTAMQVIPLEDFPESIQPYVVKPGISKGRCWFQRGLPTILYYIILEVILHIFNAIFMFHAAYLLYKENLCCSRETVPKIRSHASAKHVETFKLQFLMFIVYLIMLMVKAVGPVIGGNQFLRIMVVILSLHSAFLCLVMIQFSKSKEVVELFGKFKNRANEIRSRFVFAQEAESSVAEVTRL